MAQSRSRSPAQKRADKALGAKKGKVGKGLKAYQKEYAAARAAHPKAKTESVRKMAKKALADKNGGSKASKKKVSKKSSKKGSKKGSKKSSKK